MAETKEKRKTIQEVRAEDNKFSVVQSKTHPGFFAIAREKGALPTDLRGDYTSEVRAEEAINAYLQQGS